MTEVNLNSKEILIGNLTIINGYFFRQDQVVVNISDNLIYRASRDGFGSEVGVLVSVGGSGGGGAPEEHAEQHENAGSDEISVAGLSGLLADAQTPLAHKTSHENNGSDEISVAGLSGLLADAQTPLTHTHPQSQVTDLVTDLAAKAPDTPKYVLEESNGELTNGRVIGTDALALPDDLTSKPTTTRTWQTAYDKQVNFADVAGSNVRVTGYGRHFHRGTPRFTNGTVRLKIDGTVIWTSSAVGTGANNATALAFDSGLNAFTNSGLLKQVLIEVEAEVVSSDSSQTVISGLAIVFK